MHNDSGPTAYQAQGLADQVVCGGLDRQPGIGRTGELHRQIVSWRDLEFVDQIERDHFSIDQVIAVITHTGDSQAGRELGRSTNQSRCPIWHPVGHDR